MKELYEDLKIEVVEFCNEDVITTSTTDWDTEELEDGD